MAPFVLVEGTALWRSSTSVGNQLGVSARGRGVLGCWLWHSAPQPHHRGSALLPGCASEVGSGDGCGVFIFLLSSFYMLEWGRSRKEKKTEQSQKNTAGQETFLEMAHIGAVS